MNTRDITVWVCGMLQCAKIHCHTHTHGTHFGNTAGLPVPMFNPTLIGLKEWATSCPDN